MTIVKQILRSGRNSLMVRAEALNLSITPTTVRPTIGRNSTITDQGSTSQLLVIAIEERDDEEPSSKPI